MKMILIKWDCISSFRHSVNHFKLFFMVYLSVQWGENKNYGFLMTVSVIFFLGGGCEINNTSLLHICVVS